MPSLFTEEINIERAIISQPLAVAPMTRVVDVLVLMSQSRASCAITEGDETLEILLNEARSSCVLILEGDRLLGIFTERDALRLGAAGTPLVGMTISQVMTSSVVTLRHSECNDLFTTLNLLHHYNIRHLPIVDEYQQVIGLLTQEILQQLLYPIDLFRVRPASEVMISQVVSAAPTSSVLTLAQLMAQYQLGSVVIVEEKAIQRDNRTEHLAIPVGMVTERDIVQFQALELNFEQIQAHSVMSTPVFSIHPEASLWSVQLLMQTHRVGRVVVTGNRGELSGIITQRTLLQALNPAEIYKQLVGVEQKVSQLESEKLELLQKRTAELEAEVQERTSALQAQAEREKLLGGIANRIRASLDLQDTMNTIVTEVRQWLACDRVLIYQFQPDWTGIVLAESVATGWQSFLGHTVNDPHFAPDWIEPYGNGRIRIVNDIWTDMMTSCHRDLLLNLQVRAKVLLPIIVNDRLWGLMLVAQNDGPRFWKSNDIDLIKQIAIQAAIAIQQAELYQKAQLEIQERLRVETELRESEELYRATLSNISDAIFVTTDQGQITLVGPNVQILSGYTVDEVKRMGMIDQILGTELFDLQQLIDCGEIINIEREIQDKQGKVHTVLINVKRVQIGNGTVLYSCRDISDRKQAEQALQDSESRLRTIIETSASGLVAVNREGDVLFANPAAARIFGLAKEQLQGWPLGIPSVCGTVRPEEMELLQPCGDWRVVTMQTAPILWDGRPTCLISLSDITELKRAQRALRQSKTRYRLLVENLPVGLVVHAPDTSILTTNAKARELLELTVNQLQGKTALDPDWHFFREDETLMPPEEYPVNRVLATLEPLKNYVVGVNRPRSKTRIWVLVNAFPILDPTRDLLQIVVTFVDISDRKQTEITLLQSERRYASLAEAAPVGIFRTDPVGQCLYVNDRWCQISGLEPRKAFGEGWKQRLHPDDQDRVIAEWQESVQDNRPFRLEYRFQRPDRSIIWVSGQSVAERGEDGQIVGYIGTITDITARKRAEEQLYQLNIELECRVEQRTLELAQINRFLTLVMDSIPQRIFWKDLDSRIIGCNHLFAKDMGLTPEEVAGRGLGELSETPEETEHYRSCDQRVITTGTAELQILETVHKPDGSWIWVETNKVPLRDANGQVIGILGTYDDITDRKTAELALQESQHLISRIMEASPDILYIYDLQEQCIVYVNQEIARLLGYEPQEIQAMGSNVWKYLLHPEDLPRLIAHHRRFLAASDTDILELEYRMRDREGNWLWFISRDTIFNRDIQDHPKQTIGAASDMTERKKVDAELRQTNAELARATRLKDEFLANMSHELRTPLNAILGMAEGLQEGVFGLLNDRQEHALSTIERSGRHLLELINDILDLAKIEAGKLELQLEPVAIHYLCESSLTFVKQQAIQKQIQLQTDIPSNLADIYIDERRIRQVLINLLNNAVKFTPSGGRVTLKVWFGQTAQPEAHEDAVVPFFELPPHIPPTCSTSYLCFSVLDTGIGIAQADLGNLFQSFVQIDSSLNRQQSGTGLGLALIKQITELHHGWVTVTSEIDRGSCFTVCLPYLNENSSVEKIKVSSAQAIGQANVDILAPSPPAKILLAEDNEANINTISSYLESRGYQVEIAKDGQKAINMVKKELPDLILMDIQMPGLDGLETIRQLRLEPTLARIPIVALTALSMAEDRDRCLEAGATEYMSKPVRLKQLTTLIQQLLQG